MASSDTTVQESDVTYQPIIAGALTTAISLLFFSLRLVARRMTVKRLFASDYCLFVGMIFSFGFNALVIYDSAGPPSLGKHQSAAGTEGFSKFQKALVAVEVVYVLALAFIKTSFLLLFRQIFPGRTFKWALYIVGTIIFCWATAVVLVSIFQCQPISAFWDESERPTAQCADTLRFYIAIWVPNITTDLAILILPQSRIWKLQIDLRTKIALAATFLLGGFAIIASVIRFSTLFQIKDDDYTWSMVALGIWTATELSSAVASASMVTLRPLLLHFCSCGARDVTHKTKASRAKLVDTERTARPENVELVRAPAPMAGNLEDGILVTHTTDVQSDRTRPISNESKGRVVQEAW